MNEKNEKLYTQSFPRFADTYCFNPVTKQPEVDGQLDIVQLVQDNYVDSFSKLLNNTIDEFDYDSQGYVRIRDLDDLIEISDYIDEYKLNNNIPVEKSFEDVLNQLKQQQLNQLQQQKQQQQDKDNKKKEIVKENEKKEEIKQEI